MMPFLSVILNTAHVSVEMLLIAKFKINVKLGQCVPMPSRFDVCAEMRGQMMLTVRSAWVLIVKYTRNETGAFHVPLCCKHSRIYLSSLNHFLKHKNYWTHISKNYWTRMSYILFLNCVLVLIKMLCRFNIFSSINKYWSDHSNCTVSRYGTPLLNSTPKSGHFVLLTTCKVHVNYALLHWLKVQVRTPNLLLTITCTKVFGKTDLIATV